MRRVAFVGAAVVAALAFASSAQAASTSITAFDDVEFGNTGFHVGFGEVSSPKASCSAGRQVRLIAKKAGAKPRLLDSGVTSAEGAISGGYLKSRVGNATIKFVAPKTKGCGGASTRVKADPPIELAKAVGTAIAVLAIDGKKKSGAFAGLILVESGITKMRGSVPRCFADRKVSLYGDGELLDHGKTTHTGTWAQHVTLQEFQSIAEFTVKVRKSKGSDGSDCAASSTTFSGGT